MRMIVLLLVGCAMAVPAFAELQNVLDDPGITIWVNDVSPEILPSVNYSTVSEETKDVEFSPKTALRNITVDGSIRVRYSTGDRPLISTQRIALNYNAGNISAGVVLQNACSN